MITKVALIGHLIKDMEKSRRFHGELLGLEPPAGHTVAVSKVAKYMIRHPKKPSQGWRTFLANHMSVTAACDFFVVPTLTFKALYCFVVLSHERRRIIPVHVTHHPTDEWTARQILEAFPGDGFVPKYLHHDQDSIYGSGFRKTMGILGITEVISARQSPWQNPFVERVVGSIRRECTDHILPLGERHLVSVLRRYATYYNESRPHLALDHNSPSPRFDLGTYAARGAKNPPGRAGIGQRSAR